MFTAGKPESADEFAEYYELRWEVLRAPWRQPRGSERDEFESTADHVAVYTSAGRLVGVGRLHLDNRREAQIRYMACREGFRRRGVGSLLIAELEAIARRRGVEQIELNGRVEAVEFYERVGYQVVGPAPTMFDVIEHVRMQKILTA